MRPQTQGQAFSGERLHEDDALFGADLARHRAAYRFAAEKAAGARALDLGCGTGYGAAELADPARAVVGFDRARPSSLARESRARFARGDLQQLPFRSGCFELVVSFQVIEHLVDPSAYLAELARVLAPGGVALVSTPNLVQSDRENPFHVHEYRAQELATVLGRCFGRVEMLGVAAEGPAWAYHEQRLARIRRITRLDPLGLRKRIPRPLVEWLFARLAVVVRRGSDARAAIAEVGVEHFPVGPCDDRCLDLLAVCSEPR